MQPHHPCPLNSDRYISNHSLTLCSLWNWAPDLPSTPHPKAPLGANYHFAHGLPTFDPRQGKSLLMTQFYAETSSTELETLPTLPGSLYLYLLCVFQPQNLNHTHFLLPLIFLFHLSCFNVSCFVWKVEIPAIGLP